MTIYDQYNSDQKQNKIDAEVCKSTSFCSIPPHAKSTFYSIPPHVKSLFYSILPHVKSLFYSIPPHVKSSSSVQQDRCHLHSNQ